MRKIQIIGNIGKDAEYQTNEKGGYISFTMAAKSTPKSETIWVKCYKNGGENFAQYLTKGKKVYVSGDLGLHTWQTKEGQSRTDVLCYVDFVEFCGSKAEQEQKNVNVPFENQQRAQRVNDDLFGGQVSTNNDSWL